MKNYYEGVSYGGIIGKTASFIEDKPLKVTLWSKVGLHSTEKNVILHPTHPPSLSCSQFVLGTLIIGG